MREKMKKNMNSYIGKGIYSISEAKRLTGISTQNIRRWLYGYSYYRKGEKYYKDPVLSHDYEPMEGNYALSFLDLIEIRFVYQFRKYGISLQSIRTAASRAADLIGNSHPFTTKKFYTDKRTILAQITSVERETELIDLIHHQYEINEIVVPLLYEGIDFSQFDVAERWWPMGFDSPIVIDPNRSLGRPIINSSGTPTEILFYSVKAGNSFDSVADWYEITPEEVKAAVNFENKLPA